MTATEQLLLDTLHEHGPEMESHKLYDAASRKRKREGARNSINYQHWQRALQKLIDREEIVERYAPTSYDRPDKRYGYTYYRVVTS